MRAYRTLALLALGAATLAACDGKTKQQLALVSHADSVHVDSLSNARRELLDEVMTSTQFVNDINGELAKARSLSSKARPKLETNAELSQVNDERKEIVSRITRLVAKLDSVQERVASTKRTVETLSKKDASLVEQIAQYQANIADMQHQAETQRAQFQATIDSQTVRIASLSSQIDTLNVVRTALVDTVGQLTTEKNTAYYVIGTKDELIKKGILVENGPKHFVLFGSRPVAPARELDPTAFTKINRLADRTITLPAGEYEILSRQNPAYATPQAQKDGKITGGLTIDKPENFWASSRYLIIVRS